MWSIITNPIVSHLIAGLLGVAAGTASGIIAGAKAIEARGKADLEVAKAALEKDWGGVKTAAAALEADIQKKI